MRQAGIEGWLKTLTEPNTVPVIWNRADLSSAPCLKAPCVFYTKQSEKGVVFPVSEDHDSGREIPNFWTLINLKCLLARSVQHLKKIWQLWYLRRYKTECLWGTFAGKISSLKHFCLQVCGNGHRCLQSHNSGLGTQISI